MQSVFSAGEVVFSREVVCNVCVMQGRWCYVCVTCVLCRGDGVL